MFAEIFSSEVDIIADNSVTGASLILQLGLNFSVYKDCITL